MVFYNPGLVLLLIAVISIILIFIYNEKKKYVNLIGTYSY